MLRFLISYLTFVTRRWLHRLHKTFGYKSNIVAIQELLEMRNVLMQGVVHYANLIKLIDIEMEDLSFEMEVDEKWREAVKRSQKGQCAEVDQLGCHEKRD